MSVQEVNNPPYKRKTRWRVPFIEQMEQSECGICCLSMILAYNHCHVPLHELRERGGAGRDGITLLTLLKMAESMGMEGYGKRVEWKDLPTVQAPAILHWEGNHFVVLEKSKRGKTVILDPAIGRRVIADEELRTKYSGVVLCLSATERVIMNKPKRVWGHYFRLLGKQPWLVTTIIVWSLWIQMLALISPITTRYLVDEIIFPNELQLMYGLGVGLACLTLVNFLFVFLRSRFLVKLQNSLDWQLMSSFYKHLLRLPYQFFQLRTSGDLIVRANSNMAIRDLLTTRTVTAILDGGLVLFFLIYMLDRSPLMTGWVVLVGVLQVAVLLSMSPVIKRLSQEQILKQTAASSSLIESLRGISVVKTEGIERHTYDKWAVLYQELLKTSMKRGMAEANVDSIVNGLRYMAPLLLLWLGAWQVVSYQMTMGEMFAFFSLALAFLTPLTSFITTINQMIVIGAYLNRILDIHEAKPEQDETTEFLPPSLQGNIELNQVSFRYHPYSQIVIRDVSLQIKAGQKIAIVGPSGSGKSTLASLLLGLYHPTEGKLTFDGIDLATLDKSAFRRQIGVVLQHTFVFNCSIAANISLHDPSIPMSRIVEVAKMAGIHEDIMQMPMKYQTLVSEAGTNISGGQRQRLALARALAHSPKIMLLDEATSALDTLTEKAVETNLSDLNCTRIVIAHRLSTIMNADLIVVLDEGQIVEQGTHYELVQRGGRYAEFYRIKSNESDKSKANEPSESGEELERMQITEVVG